jgi:predicted RND superfamily exporter protein
MRLTCGAPWSARRIRIHHDGGVGVLITSSLVPFRQMGQVTGYAIGLALIAAVIVLPSMLAPWDR